MQSERDTLAAHVDALIAKRGANRTSVARAAGLNPHFIRQWLNGRVRSPGVAQLQAVARVLGVDLLALLTPTAKRSRP